MNYALKQFYLKTLNCGAIRSFFETKLLQEIGGRCYMGFKSISNFVSKSYKFTKHQICSLYRKFINNKHKLMKIPRLVTNFFCDFFGEHLKFEKQKMIVSLSSFAFVVVALIVAGSISRVAIYVNGERIGYAANEAEAAQIISEYNDFASESNVSPDILLQNEISLSQGLLSSDAVQSAIDGVKNEEFTNAYLLYLDDTLIVASESPDALRNVVSQIENDVTSILGNNASIYNNIEIKNEFYPTSQLNDSSKLYSTIIGSDTIQRENITPSVILTNDNMPVKIYSLNGILFETYEYYKVERFLKSETVYQDDDTMYEGTQKVLTVGNDGSAVDMYKRTMFDGEVQNTELIDTTITIEKTDTIILCGTKKIVFDDNPKIFIFPLKDPERYSYSSEFGGRKDPFTGEYSYHSGLDIACPLGTTVVAADSGIVVESVDSNGSAGYHITILHDNGLSTTYMHLSKRLVEVGERVYAGQEIALSGSTGRSTGPHLHFTVLDEDGKLVNPRKYTELPK